MSTFLVSSRNQPPHNPNLISHLVPINNPPSRAEVSVVHFLSLVDLHIQHETKQNKERLLISLSRFEAAWAHWCVFSVKFCRFPSEQAHLVHLVKKSGFSPRVSVGFHYQSVDLVTMLTKTRRLGHLKEDIHRRRAQLLCVQSLAPSATPTRVHSLKNPIKRAFSFREIRQLLSSLTHTN